MENSTIVQEISGHTLAATIKLESAVHSGAFLLLEGDTDARLFQKFKHTDCSIIVCFNRDNVIRTMVELIEDEVVAVAIVDRDYDSYILPEAIRDVTCVTDFNDIEVMIAASPALEHVVAEFGSAQKTEAETALAEKPLNDLVFEWASTVGAIRFSSHRNGWNLNFKNMSFRFSDNRSPVISLEDTINLVVQRTTATPNRPSAADVSAKVEAVLGATVDKKQICRGHDVVRVLAKALRNKIGTCSDFDSDERCCKLAANLRLAYEFEYFARTSIFSKLKDIERQTAKNLLRN